MTRITALSRPLLAWAAAHSALGTGCALAGVPLFGLGPHPAPAAWNWAAVAVAALVAAVLLARHRYGERPAFRRTLIAAAALCLASGFSLLMDVLMLLTGSLPAGPAAAAHHALGLTGAVLLAINTRTRKPTSGTPAPPAAASPRVHLVALVGAAAFLPYATMKTVWAFGGTFAGVSGAEVLEVSRRNGASGVWLALEGWGLDPTVLFALVGVFLLFGLVRPWGQVFPRWTVFLAGRRVPRWLPLAPAVLGAATLVPYGLLGSGYLILAGLGVLDLPPGDFRTGEDALLVSWAGLGAFAPYGLALAVAAHSYWRRTRPLAPARPASVPAPGLTPRRPVPPAPIRTRR
ncbi:hypothetical protein GCM10010329_15780 [Streptomyces spiroverticillatus]|uniref:DUF4184 family protein n=1 Tax=Streptomyces finlayi TaxID=67296 RepID=A0A918X355_9ACTN|nr:hypothetical protein [Streptomyces finlayi]GGZ95047.1 hypothetical protein GCM10010329_15780 [Streptomyces spiroverticillatus]GHD07350.1 hypothetical protein GCM10010334_59810 [Streptomyces finlayi]